VKLSIEIPTSVLPLLSAYTDSDFVLAHRVLEDPDYASFHEQRAANRELILDNSFHELGVALPIRDLLEAADRVNADYVIAPDKLGDPIWTAEQFLNLYQAQKWRRGKAYGLAVVMQGATFVERRTFMATVRAADMLCLPFRAPRIEWFVEHEKEIRHHWRRIHLLGVNELTEFRRFFLLSTSDFWAGTAWSVDTAKPVKWGMSGEFLDSVESLRGNPLSSKALLGLSFAEVEPHIDMILNNIHILRRQMR
jgi:hypothetical protein